MTNVCVFVLVIPMSHTDPLPCWFWEVSSFQHWWSMAKLLWHATASFRGAHQLPQRHTNHQKQCACNLWKGPLEAIHKSIWVYETRRRLEDMCFNWVILAFDLFFTFKCICAIYLKACLMVPHKNSPPLCFYLL